MSKYYFYALSDNFTGDYPIDYCSGFANTKTVVAFHSKKERETWLKSTKLLTAKPISRTQAEKFTKWEKGEYYGYSCEKVKPVRLLRNGDFIILKKSSN
jgi:hypothetical protein